MADRPVTVDYGINTKEEFDATVVTLKVYWYQTYNLEDFETDLQAALQELAEELRAMAKERLSGTDTR